MMRAPLARFPFLLLAIVAIAALLASSQAAPPEVYATPFFQSPVRADPNDLLMIAGHKFGSSPTVVYRIHANTTQSLPDPTYCPDYSSAVEGVLEIVRQTDSALTVRIPTTWTKDQSYALWVKGSAIVVML